MAEVIRMPLMSDTMTEGVIVDWFYKVGDAVKSGDILAEVETDKATMELENYDDGVLLHIGVEKGKAALVNSIIAIIGEKGEDVKAILDSEPEIAGGEEPAKEEVAESEPATTPEPVATATPAKASAPKTNPATSAASSNGKLKASPLAKSMAKESGIDITALKGSGDEGRIIKRDIEDAIANGVTPQAQASIALPVYSGEEGYTENTNSQMRKAIARRLGESKFSAPHFYLTMEINMDVAVESRKRLNEVSPVKISFNDLIVKACANALRKHPAVNSSWMGDTIRTYQHVHVGVAVAIEDGLIVPVIKFADGKSLAHISQETKDLAGKAKNKQLQPEEFSGNTFTISNLGMFGIEEFTAIVNPPDACILAVGAINKVPRVIDDEIKVANVMKVTLSCDHRVVDGAVGAQFLNTVKSNLEDPVRMLI